jgi:hypothetical protein
MASRRSAGSVAGGAFVEQAPRCRCDLVAVSKISGKEGDNKGRTFWICSKISKASQCKLCVALLDSDGKRRAEAYPAPTASSGETRMQCQSTTEATAATADPTLPLRRAEAALPMCRASR